MLFKIFFIISLSLAQCAIEDFSTMSWNMRGAMNGVEQNKWTLVIEQFLRRGIQLIAIQEAGTPNSLPINHITDITNNFIIENPDAVVGEVRVLQWNIEPIAYIYFLNIDSGGRRVNLAIATTLRASRIILLQTNLDFARPVLGIVYNNNIFYTFHATSRNQGPDAPAMIRRIYNYNVQRFYTSWIIFGDFNQDPIQLWERLSRKDPTLLALISLVYQSHATQTRGGNLDYAIVPYQVHDPRVFARTTQSQYGSDHFPVQFHHHCNRYT